MKSSIYKLIACACMLICLLVAFASCDVPQIVLPEVSTGNENNNNNESSNNNENNGGSSNNSGAHKHSYTANVTAPTCVTAGYTKNTCTCGDSYMSNYVEALGHNYLEPKYVVEDGKTVCEDGGTCVMVCKVCNIPVENPVGAMGHSVSNWSIVKESTLSAEGTIYGICGECDGVVDVNLPRLDIVKYLYSEQLTETSCTDKKGVGIYSIFVDCKGNLSSKESNGLQKISITVDISGSYPHVLGGKVMSNDTYPSSYDGVLEFSGMEATCTKNGSGYFKCDSCKAAILVVTTKSHTFEGSATVMLAPDCDTAGSEYSYCTECKSNITYSVPALGHSYACQFVSDDNTTLVFDVSCSRCSISETMSTSTFERKIIKPTCLEKGSIKYTVAVYGKSAEVVRELDRVGHSLGGVEMDLNKTYDPNMDGIVEFSNFISTCEERGKGYYNCDYCDEMQMIITLRAHTGNMTVVSEPGCDSAGSGAINCTVCGRSVTEEIPPLGHSYNAELISVDASAIAIDVNCSVCNDEKYIETGNYRSVVSEASCIEHGSITYYVTYDSEIYTVTQKTDKNFHKLNGEFMDPSLAYYPEVGINEFANYQATATENGKGYYICDTCGELQMVITKFKEK